MQLQRHQVNSVAADQIEQLERVQHPDQTGVLDRRQHAEGVEQCFARIERLAPLLGADGDGLCQLLFRGRQCVFGNRRTNHGNPSGRPTP